MKNSITRLNVRFVINTKRHYLVIMFRKYFFNCILLIASLFFFQSCSPAKKTIQPKKTILLEKLYQSGIENFENGKYGQALIYFEEVEKNFSYTIWAQKSMLMRSYMYYDAADYMNALAVIKKFKTLHPTNNNLIYADYLIAMCLFEQINDSSLSQTSTILAKKQFQKIIIQYPNSDYAIDAKFKLDLLEEYLAGKEMYIARYYIKKRKWLPAAQRLNIILENYQTTIYIEEALHRLVEINYKIGNLNAAKKYAKILGYNYNNSDWYKRSYNTVEGKSIRIGKKKEKKSLKKKLKNLIQLK
jgi:outer membrane protein assembly factor BamD